MPERHADREDLLRLQLVVLRCQAGDEHAFAALMERFGARTHGYLRGLVGDDADDVQQEVWLSVYRHIRDLADAGAFRTWLFRTTRHRAIDHLRRLRREQELFVQDDPPSEVTVVPPDAEEPTWQAPLFEEALATLPPLQREVLLLRYRDALSYAEIALVIGCTVGTVRSRLHYAKARMHDVLCEHRRPSSTEGASLEGDDR